MNGTMVPTMPAQPEHNLMEKGPNSNNLAAAAVSRHPVDNLQMTLNENPFHNLEYVRHAYGSALAMRLATEQKIAAEQHLAGAHPAGNLYRDVVTGNDVRLDFDDFLALPQNRPDVVEQAPHVVMESQLGMKM